MTTLTPKETARFFEGTHPLFRKAAPQPPEQNDAALIAAAPALLDALYSALNIETAAILGAQCESLQGLDIKYHFDKIRAAIQSAES